MCVQAREPLSILHSVLSEIARRFVLLEVHAWASEQSGLSDGLWKDHLRLETARILPSGLRCGKHLHAGIRLASIAKKAQQDLQGL